MFLSSLYVTEAKGPHEWSAVIPGSVDSTRHVLWFKHQINHVLETHSFSYRVHQRPMSHNGKQNFRSCVGP